ncbi:MAG: DUF1361 domain-containing protein [Patescibacteria group bacterium]|nr:DUF1361 domain-containing protein [Patescibacteria group bacterium]
MSFTHFFSIKNIVDTFGLFYVNDYPFLMMVWNLFLAMVPFGLFLLFFSYWQKTKFKKTGQKIRAVIIFFFWFIFLPNAAYLVVGNRHLLNFCPADSANSVCIAGTWQIMYFFVYSVLGWVLFAIYLSQMRQVLAKIFNAKIARNLIYGMIPFVSWAVLLGLIERYNSWDIFLHPLLIFQNLLKYLVDWEYFRNLLVFTAGYYVLYFFGTVIFKIKLTKN